MFLTANKSKHHHITRCTIGSRQIACKHGTSGKYFTENGQLVISSCIQKLARSTRNIANNCLYSARVFMCNSFQVERTRWSLSDWEICCRCTGSQYDKINTYTPESPFDQIIWYLIVEVQRQKQWWHYWNKTSQCEGIRTLINWSHSQLLFKSISFQIHLKASFKDFLSETLCPHTIHVIVKQLLRILKLYATHNMHTTPHIKH